MNATVEQIKSQARSLTVVERSDLICFLLDTLEPDSKAEQEWRTEIARRVSEIRAGTAAGRPLEDVLAELREVYP